MLRAMTMMLCVASPILAQGTVHRDASLEDLVRASSGRLGLYARNLRTGDELSLNGVGERHLGGLTRLFTAAAAVAKAKALETGLKTTLAYPAAAYRGTASVLRERHDELFTIEALVRATILQDDHAAHDLLANWLGSDLAHWVKDLSPDGIRPVATYGRRDRFLLRHLDPRFAQVSDPAAQRWLHGRDSSGVTPRPFTKDPRHRDDHVSKLGAAWRSWYGQRANAGTLKGFAEGMAALLRAPGRGAARDDVIGRWLRGVPTVACAREYDLHLTVHGLDARSWQRAASAALVETPKGAVVIVAHIRGMASERDATHLLAVMGEAALRRLAPAAWRSPRTTLPTTLPASVRSISLCGGDSPRQKTDFAVGETARLLVATSAPKDTTMVVRWTRSDGSHVREARALPPRAFTEQEFQLPLDRAGEYAVQVAVDAREIWSLRFQARD